jgi:hypothetical protein
VTKSRWAPYIVPDFDESVFGASGLWAVARRAYAETHESATDLERVIEGLIAGQYDNPFRIIAFNTAEGWSRETGWAVGCLSPTPA